MPLKKKSSSSISLNEAQRFCERNNIKVYPVNKNGLWFIQVDVDGNLITYTETIGSGLNLQSPKFNAKGKNWCQSINKTIIHWAQKYIDASKKVKQ